ncbi:MAG: TolC family protein [Terracidiphilus sp.]|nr:TolC family protein [Terracidiphilus sp.]
MAKRILIQTVQLILGGAFVAAASVAQQPLMLRQAIELALKQNPEVTAARAGVDEARAGRSMAKSALLPQVSFTEDMSRGNDPVYAFGTRLRQQRFTQADFALTALNTPEPLGNFSSRIAGGWQVFDSLQTQRQIRGAKWMERSAGSQAGAVDQKVVFGVVAAYLQALYAEREVETAQHETETAEALLKSADDHVKAGLAVESDRMAAEANLAARKLASIAAEGDRAMAWDGLRLAMGAPELAATPLAPFEARNYPAGELEQEVAIALKNRLDLAAMGETGQAQSAAVSAARSALGPRMNVYGNWENDRNSLASSGGTNWLAGVQISIDLQPLTRRAQLAQQNAVQMRVNAQAESYRQQVRMQVGQAHTQRTTAGQSMATAKAAVDQAAEGLRIVKNRYEAGLATITDLLRAEDAERESRTNYWRAAYGNTVAYAQLLFATGTLTPEAAEALQ